MHLYSGQRILAESAVPRVDDASYNRRRPAVGWITSG
jgi:hypothetical protein